MHNRNQIISVRKYYEQAKKLEKYYLIEHSAELSVDNISVDFTSAENYG